VSLHVSVTQNALLFKLASLPLGGQEGVEVSLGYALKRGMERLFQLEESELGLAFVGAGEQRALLFHERAEGGLGALRRLVEEEKALSEVAQAALEALHFDAQGSDLKPECARACHECLLSYGNQREAHLLDRHAVRDLLLCLAQAQVEPQEGVGERERLEALEAASASGLERRFLRFLHERGLRLPDEAQYRIGEAHTVADFLYRPHVAVFVDGPHHGEERQRRIDERQREALLDLGYRVIVVPPDPEAWEGLVREHPEVFAEE